METKISFPEAGGSQPSTQVSPSSKRITRGHSCLVCQQRKVRCDGQKPCASCTKSRLECIQRPPGAPPRRKAKLPLSKEDVLSRIKRCEEQLLAKIQEGETSSIQANIKNNGPVDPEQPDVSRKASGKMIVDRGHARYIENNLWVQLDEELQCLKDTVDASSEDDLMPTSDPIPSGENLVFGRSVLKSISSFHPNPVQIFKLWQTFLDNVNPLSKLIHAPTVQQQILQASGNLDNVSPSLTALMFSIYLSAVTTLQEEECFQITGETRAASLTKFSNAAQQALINAKFLKSSDIVVLQALTLFLISMRLVYDPQTLWTLTGLAVRSAQRIGLHRETSSQGLSLFSAEMRRRLWWQVMILDSRSAQLSGAAVGVPALMASDTKRPSNINDSDLNPAMKVLPVEPIGVTEMLFCCIRYELGHFMRMSQLSRPFDPARSLSAPPVGDSDKPIAELEHRIEENYLKFCDPSIPSHLLAIYMSRSAFCQVTLLAHYCSRDDALPPERKEKIFMAGVKMLEYDNLSHINKGMSGYMWHVDVFFPFHALIYVTGELAKGAVHGDLANKTWQLIDQVYAHHPTFLTDTKNGLYVAIGSLVVKAWLKRQGERPANRSITSPHSTPHSIAILQSQRNWQVAKTSQGQSHVDAGTRQNEIAFPNGQNNQAYTGNPAQWSTNMPNQTMLQQFGTIDGDVIDWEYWGALLDGQELPMFGGIGPFANT